MYLKVRLLNGYKNPLIYKVPDSWSDENLEGRIVSVPLKTKVKKAFVEKQEERLNENQTFKVREAIDVKSSPRDQNFSTFVKKISDYYAVDKIEILERLSNLFSTTESEIEQKSIQELNLNLTLTTEQKAIVDKISNHIGTNKHYIGLIHGVTGSGKTEIYKNLIYKILSLKQSVLFLLPEVSLAIEFYNRFKKEFSDEFNIYSYHSATSSKYKKALWQELINQKPVLIIGVHLPVFLPISNLGLIIIDEEHDIGFQEKKHPKFNTKEIALIRSQIYKIPIILGSATPSISSLYAVKNKNWELFRLKNRFKGGFPEIKLVKLANRERGDFWISRDLEKAIGESLNKNEKSLIFLNRRGYCFFVQCKLCGDTPNCISCSVSLTLHSDKTLRCHYCNFSIQEPNSCLKCNAKEKDIIKRGIGTQQIVKILSRLFPEARIGRLDLDTTVDRKNLQKTLNDFDNHKIDILVGTQTITKGYNFTGVTLIGILWADANLNFPIYNAAETTLQQIIQVAGRAGRQGQKSVVIVQTIKEHEIFNFINEQDFENFYEFEIQNRIAVKYPPHIRLAELEVKNQNELILETEVKLIKKELNEIINQLGLKVTLLGPVSPVISKIKNYSMKKFYLKSENANNINIAFTKLNRGMYTSRISFTPNPLC